MRLLAWFYRNWADTDEGFHPDLHPLRLQLSLDEALKLVRDAIQKLPRWQIENFDVAAGTMHATRRTPLWRFIDDIHIRIEKAPTGVWLHARSQSRLGKGDLGQNRRNLLELFGALQLPPCPPSAGS